MSLYVQLAKHGDILSILPILQQEYKETGMKPSLLVSKEYSQIPLELPWLHTIVFDGHWQDLKGAVKLAKGYSVPTLIPQTFGDGWPVQRKHPSFQLDQWDRCGRLHQWGTLPLDLPRRSPTSFELCTPKDKGQRYIIFADHSQSSPFPQKEDLATRLKETFPQHQIVRLSSIRTPRLLDLLTLYDAADLIVTVETMHLHLSLATKTPVIALATDNPSRWHGSAYHPRFALHVRYGDYENRKAELLHVAWRAVNKVSAPVAESVEQSHECGYNMSILRDGNNLLRTYRFHPAKSWRTEMVIETGGKSLPLRPPIRYEKFSFEDGRLFMFHGKPHLSATVSRNKLIGETAGDKCVTGYGRLRDEGDAFTVEDWIEPRYARNDWTAQEKNVVFFEHDSQLHAIWTVSPEQTVIQLNMTGEVRNVWKTPAPACSFGQYRGGTQPMSYRAGYWLRFVHAQQVNKKSDLWWQYSLAAVVQESIPPFRIVQVSKQPILAGNELYSPGCSHWKPRICIPYGAIEESGGWLVTIGQNDCDCAAVHLTHADLNL